MSSASSMYSTFVILLVEVIHGLGLRSMSRRWTGDDIEDCNQDNNVVFRLCVVRVSPDLHLRRTKSLSQSTLSAVVIGLESHWLLYSEQATDKVCEICKLLFHHSYSALAPRLVSSEDSAQCHQRQQLVFRSFVCAVLCIGVPASTRTVSRDLDTFRPVQYNWSLNLQIYKQPLHKKENHQQWQPSVVAVPPGLHLPRPWAPKHTKP